MKPLQTEVLIVGTGPAGASLAVWLAEQGWDCTLVDRARFPRKKPCASCFSPHCFPFLKRLGLEETIRSGQMIRYAAAQTPRRSVRIDATKQPFGPLFYVYPREVFDAMLVDRARALPVRLLEGVAIERLIKEGPRVVGGRAKDREIRAKVTVVATGANTRFLPPERKKGMRTYQTLTGWFEGLPELEQTTTDSFTAPWLMGTGWVFPEPDGKANVGVMVHEHLLRASGRNLRDIYQAYLESRFARERLKGAKPVGRLAGSPIRYTLRPEGIIGDGFLMIGEACLLTHPLTGEGISQAFQSADLAAKVLEEARGAGVFDRGALLPYSRGIRKMFGKTFRNAGIVRFLNDRPFLLEASVLTARWFPPAKSMFEKRLDRVII